MKLILYKYCKNTFVKQSMKNADFVRRSQKNVGFLSEDCGKSQFLRNNSEEKKQNLPKGGAI